MHAVECARPFHRDACVYEAQLDDWSIVAITTPGAARNTDDAAVRLW
jgi:hypothetical protein